MSGGGLAGPHGDDQRPTSDRRPSRRTVAIHLAILVALGVLAYSNTFSVPFVFDDLPNIVDNPLIRDLGNLVGTPDGGAAAGTGRTGGFAGRWVAFATFALDYRVHGLAVAGYHAVNLAVHVGAAVCLYLFLGGLLGSAAFAGSRLREARGGVPLLAAALFVAHPIQTQAVTYVVQRMTSLAGLLCLLSIVTYAASGRAGTTVRRVILYAISIASLALAMGTKQNAFAFPVIIALFDLLFLTGQAGRRTLRLLPPLLTMAIVPWGLLSAGGDVGSLLDAADTATRVQTSLSRGAYLLTESRVVVTYIRMLLYPVGQSLDHDFAVSRSAFEPAVLGSLALLAALLVAAIVMIRTRGRLEPAYRLAGFGVLWFFVALSVESSVIPIVDVIFEHRVYLPSAGLFMAIGVLAWLAAPRRHLRAAAVLAGIVVGLLGAATFARNRVWSDNVSLWRDVVAKAPGKARGHYNLAVALAETRRTAEAAAEYRQAIAAEPKHYRALSNLGNILREAGRLEEATVCLERAAELAPEDKRVRNNRGLLYKQQGRLDLAIVELEHAVSADPSFAEAAINLGNTYRAAGRLEDAVRWLRRAVALAPVDAVAHNGLGVALAQQGSVAEAIGEYELALRLDPDYVEAHNNLGNAYRRVGRPGDAVRQLERALSLSPGNPVILANLRAARDDLERATRRGAQR